MKKKYVFCLLCLLLSNIESVKSQSKTFTYSKYAITNYDLWKGVVLNNSPIIFSKDNNKFNISIYDSGKNISVLSNITMKGYDEFDELFVYLGDVSEKYQKGKCIIKTKQKLDSYLNNYGSLPSTVYYNDYSILILYTKMSKKIDDTDLSISMPNRKIRIYPIRNKTKEELKTEEDEIKFNELKRQKELQVIDSVKSKILNSVTLDSKINNLKELSFNTHKDSIKNWLYNISYDKIIYSPLISGSAVFLDIYNLYVKDEYIDIYKVIRDLRIKLNPIYAYSIKTPSYYNKEFTPNPQIENNQSPKLYFKFRNYPSFITDNYVTINNVALSDTINFSIDLIQVKTTKSKQLYKYRFSYKYKDLINAWCSNNIKEKGIHYIQVTTIGEEVFISPFHPRKEDIWFLKSYFKMISEKLDFK